MRYGRWLLLLHLLIVAAGCRDDLQGQDPASRASRERQQRQLANELRRSARGLVLVQRVLRWYALTGRESARTAEQLQGVELWLTPEHLFALRRLENSAGLRAAQRSRWPCPCI